MRIRIVNDDDEVVGEFVILVEHSRPPAVVMYEGRPHVPAPELCRAGEPPVYREPGWSLVEPIGWGCG